MNILHAHTDPTMLDRLKTMLAHSHRADIAVGYLFISGFSAVAREVEGVQFIGKERAWMDGTAWHRGGSSAPATTSLLLLSTARGQERDSHALLARRMTVPLLSVLSGPGRLRR